MRQRLIVILSLVLLAIAAATDGFADPNPNVALVIGNADYPDADAPLREPVNDAKAFGDELKRRGFDVYVGQNLRKSAMQKAFDDFFGKIGSESTAVLFFSGFGIQSDRRSYLIPTDAQVWNESDVRRDGFVLDDILGEMTRRGAKIKIVIIDASRKNPFERRFRSVSAGLAPLTASRGSVVMTSAPADAIAETSPPVFVSNLLAKLKGSDAGIEQIFNDTRKDVSRLTNGAQVPGVTSSLDTDVSLGRLPGSGLAPGSKPGTGTPAVASAPPAPPPAVTAPPPQVAVAPPPPPPPPVAVAPPPPPSPPVAVAPPSPPPAVTTAPSSPPPPPVVAAAPPPAASPPAAPPVAAVTPPTDPEAEARHDYVLAEDAGTANAWKNFAAKYPSGYYHDMAVQQLAKVTPPAAPPAQPSPPPAAAAPPVPASTPPSDTAKADDTDAPTDLPGYYRRGQRRAVAGNFPLAISDFSEVIHRDPKHAGALNDRCWVRALLGELQDALKDCNAALAVAPSYPDALDSRGLVNLKLGQYAKAVQDYNAALTLDSKHASALYGRGIAKRHMGDNAGAKADIEAAKAVQSTIVDEFAGYGVQ
ncbi:MAG TPA: caspase family protein [Xanthobacteraceae bacterium]|jgi:hypothetical protein|nr:caspase family protein [Xanthobacteraceae bacterium]